MQRLTARFLLLFALAGTFAPLALAVTATPPHACCLRKSTHQCHGSDPDERAIRSTACCNHDCCRAATTSQCASPQPRITALFTQKVDERVAELNPDFQAAVLSASQSTRAPPQVSLI
jgi:hypothetical protein